jgi:hypothetical protein
VLAKSPLFLPKVLYSYKKTILPLSGSVVFLSSLFLIHSCGTTYPVAIEIRA